MSHDTGSRRHNAGATHLVRNMIISLVGFLLAEVFWSGPVAVGAAAVIVLVGALWRIDEIVKAVRYRHNWLGHAETCRLAIGIGVITGLGLITYLYAVDRLGYAPATLVLAFGAAYAWPCGFKETVAACWPRVVRFVGTVLLVFVLVLACMIMETGLVDGLVYGLTALAVAAVGTFGLPRLLSMTDRLAEIEIIGKRGGFSPVGSATVVADILAADLLFMGASLFGDTSSLDTGWFPLDLFAIGAAIAGTKLAKVVTSMRYPVDFDLTFTGLITWYALLGWVATALGWMAL